MTKLVLQIKRIVLFLFSPFIALAYMASIPVVGIVMLLRSRSTDPASANGRSAGS
jgi:hypothetical protein